jgi:hypothetical protein
MRNPSEGHLSLHGREMHMGRLIETAPLRLVTVMEAAAPRSLGREAKDGCRKAGAARARLLHSRIFSSGIAFIDTSNLTLYIARIESRTNIH